jgi:NTP pyrophosphatase (non-canonical NTP hydrolase)
VGFPSELADIVIRVADLAGALGIDLAEAIRIKLAFNRTRTHRHGGKKA